MSRPWQTGNRNAGRAGSFTEEFKAGAVRLVLDEGKTVGAAARDLDLTESALRELGRARPRRSRQGQDWRPDDGRARGARRACGRKKRELRMERDDPKKGRGLLREGPAVKFAWIQAEKAHYPVQQAVSVAAA